MGCMAVKDQVLNAVMRGKITLSLEYDIPEERRQAELESVFKTIEKAVKQDCNQEREKSCYTCMNKWMEVKRALDSEPLTLKTRKLVNSVEIG